MTTTRIYLVTQTAEPTKQGRLVRAQNQAQALRHVTADTLQASVAGQDDLVRLVAAGVAVETAGSGAVE
jgi:hypothetical protein